MWSQPRDTCLVEVDGPAGPDVQSFAGLDKIKEFCMLIPKNEDTIVPVCRTMKKPRVFCNRKFDVKSMPVQS